MRYDVVPTTRLIACSDEIKEFIFPPSVSNILFHAYIICFFKVAWNTHTFIFGWFEYFLMGISFEKKKRRSRSTSLF